MFMHKVRRNKPEAERLFRLATTAHPEHASILIKYASFKKFCGDLFGAEELFKRAVEVSRPGDGEALGAYAVFLHAVKQDSGMADQMYERAVEEEPDHANNLSNYGLFLTDVKVCGGGGSRHCPSLSRAKACVCVGVDVPFR